MLLAPLRPLADVIDLTGEAVAAVVTVAVGALANLLLGHRPTHSLTDPGEGWHQPRPAQRLPSALPTPGAWHERIRW